MPSVPPAPPTGAPPPPSTAPGDPTDWWGDAAPGAGPPHAPAASAGTPQLAVWALISAIAGFLFCGVVLGPLGVVLGFLARQRIRAHGTPGDGLAIAAMVVGTVAFVVNVAVIAVLLANPDLLDTAAT